MNQNKSENDKFDLKLNQWIFELENVCDGLDQLLLLSQEVPTLSKNIDKINLNK